MTPPLVYVGGPFRAKTTWQLVENIRTAEAAGFKLAQLGAIPVIPHTMFGNFDRTLTDAFWIDATLLLLRQCEAMLVVGDYKSSEGTLGEIQDCKRRNVPTFTSILDVKAWLDN